MGCISHYFHCLFGSLWPGNIFCGAKSKGNRSKKSIRGYCYQSCFFIIKRFFKTGFNCQWDCFSDSLVGNKQMAAGICLSYKCRMVGVWIGRGISHCYCIFNGKLPGSESCVDESCKVIENRIKAKLCLKTILKPRGETSGRTKHFPQ